MKTVITYLIIVLVALFYGLVVALQNLPAGLEALQVGIICAISGGVGGCTYCLRGVYLNACVHKSWDQDWRPWYFIRPIVSVICGGVSYLFLKAGLLILESGINPDASELGFYAFAFIAGLNVDKFITKIEDISQATWGIEKSRMSNKGTNKSSK